MSVSVLTSLVTGTVALASDLAESFLVITSASFLGRRVRAGFESCLVSGLALGSTATSTCEVVVSANLASFCSFSIRTLRRMLRR